jgi:uncharacterized protein YbjT (DUF2867 family)
LGSGASRGVLNAPILVTGATGNVGLEVVKGLVAAGTSVRGAVTDPERARAVLPSDLEIVRFDFTDANTFRAALENVQRVFLVRPPQMSNAHAFKPFLEAARAMGVTQIVFLSLLGAQKNRVVPHRGIEDAILELGLGHVFLRPSFFMQNLSAQHRDDIRLRDRIAVPAGNGKTSFIDARDIAAVGVHSLLSGEVNVAHDLTGAEALTYAQVAALFTEVLGRPIRYTHPNIVQFALNERAHAVPWAFIAVMIGIYSVARFGAAGRVTDDVRRILGRDPISMRQFIQDYRQAWTR